MRMGMRRIRLGLAKESSRIQDGGILLQITFTQVLMGCAVGSRLVSII
jgi:hypothetical protein